MIDFYSQSTRPCLEELHKAWAAITVLHDKSFENFQRTVVHCYQSAHAEGQGHHTCSSEGVMVQVRTDKLPSEESSPHHEVRLFVTNHRDFRTREC